MRFDDLRAEEADYSYRITHCDLNWQASGLLESEYIAGYATQRIDGYENAFNTLQPYTHYELTIPNQYTRLKLSGNHTITVLDENDQAVFQRRFVVYEPMTSVGVSIHKSRDIRLINHLQSVEFSIHHPKIRIDRPAAEVFPVILQNVDWQTAISGLTPQFYRGDQLLYKYDKESRFWGGNEFLYFDTKSIRNSSLHIARAELGANLYHTYLYTDQKRVGQPYTLLEDINGGFVVRTLDSDDQHREADYSWVHFSLENPGDQQGKELYISGRFNNWALTAENKMAYHAETGSYRKAILLKQGFYNYRYVSKSSDGDIRNFQISGSHYQTENQYTVIVYYRKFGARYTRVIVLGQGSSTIINP